MMAYGDMRSLRSLKIPRYPVRVRHVASNWQGANSFTRCDYYTDGVYEAQPGLGLPKIPVYVMDSSDLLV